MSRNTVRRALAADAPPRYERVGKGSLVDAVDPQIRELLTLWPTMPATVIAERVAWSHSLTILKDRVRVLRPLFVPPDPASRTTYLAGELMQCDLWFPPVDVPLGAGQVGRPPVLVMVSGYSRWISALMLPSRPAPPRSPDQLPALSLVTWTTPTDLVSRNVDRYVSRDNEVTFAEAPADGPKSATVVVEPR